jgi:hypothetical protein
VQFLIFAHKTGGNLLRCSEPPANRKETFAESALRLPWHDL